MEIILLSRIEADGKTILFPLKRIGMKLTGMVVLIIE